MMWNDVGRQCFAMILYAMMIYFADAVVRELSETDGATSSLNAVIFLVD